MMDTGWEFCAFFAGAGVALVVLIFALSAVIDWQANRYAKDQKKRK